MRKYGLIAAIALIVAISLGVVLIAAAGATGTSVYPVDKDHGLTDEEKIEEYEEDGVASAHLAVPNATVTVADSSSDVGLSTVGHSDIRNTYVRFEHNEDINRHVRIFIPEDYVCARISEDHESVGDDNTVADIKPTTEGNYTVMTVHFKGETDAVFKLPREPCAVMGYMDTWNKRVNETIGWQVPTLLATPDWRHINAESFDGSTYAIEKPEDEGIMVQVDDSGVNESAYWIPMTSCDSRSSGEVCVLSEDDNKVVVATRSDDPPQVRYTYGNNVIEGFKASSRDLRQSPDRISDFLDDLREVLGG